MVATGNIIIQWKVLTRLSKNEDSQDNCVTELKIMVGCLQFSAQIPPTTDQYLLWSAVNT